MTNQAVQKQDDKQTPKTLLQSLMDDSLKNKLSAHCGNMLTPDRLLRVACSTISRNPLLGQCTPASVYLALTNCAQLGLEPGLSGEAYLVPFKNGKTGKYEVQFIAGYQGLLKLARNSGEIQSVSANVVYKGDGFDFSLGDDEFILHKPEFAKEQKDEDIIAVYAVVKLKDGGVQRVVLPRWKIDKIRNQSRAGNSGPWVTHFDEMAKKTVLRAIYKLLPKSAELKKALEIEDEFEGKKVINAEKVPRVQPGDLLGLPETDAEESGISQTSTDV